MKTSKLFISSLIAAAAMSTIPAVADVIELVNGQETFVSLSNTGAGNTYTYSAPEDGATDNGGWIWAGGSRTGIYSTPVVFGSSGDPAHLSGTGLIAVGFCGGFGSTWKDGWVYVFDFTNTDASAFSGKFSLVNEWNNDATARLSGASWSNVEYLFGGVSREKNWAVATRGYGNAYRGADTLELQGATTLAGISGVSEGYGYGSVSDINAKESLTTNAASAELTLTGAGEYAFYGSVGDSAHRIGLVKTGSGTQTFGGAAKYLSSVSVSAGTLALTGGSVVISGEAAVAGGAKLNLSGADVTLASAVSNSGTVTVNSSTVFALSDSLKSGDVYTLISNNKSGNVVGWNMLSRSNFRYADGKDFSGRSTFNVSTAGTVTITGSALSLYWKGGDSGMWDTSSADVWGKDSASGTSETFVAGDDVTFDTDGAVAVTVSSSGVTAGTMTLSAGTVTLSGGNVTANTANITAGTLELSSDTKLTTHGGITVSGAGTLKISSKTNIGGNVTVGTGGTFDLNGATRDISTTGFGTITLAGGKLTSTGWNVDASYQQFYTLTVTADSEVGGTGNFGLIGPLYAATTLNLGANTLTKTDSNDFWIVNTTISGDGGALEATEGRFRGRPENKVVLGDGVTMKTSGTAGTLNLLISSMGANSNLTLAGTTVSTVAISGTVGADSGNATINISNGNKVSYTNTTAKSLSADITISGDGSTFSVSDENGADHLNYEGSTAITVKDGGTLALGSNHWTIGQNNSISLDGGNITGTSPSSQDGNLDIISAKTISVGNTFGKESNISAAIRLNENLTLDVAADTVLNITGEFAGSDNVSKTGAGTLKLAGTSTLSGAVSVASGGALDFSDGTVSLSSAVSNSGTVTVNSNTVFLLSDSLKNGDAYTLISNNESGNVDGWNSLTISNFRDADGTDFSGRSTFNVSTAGAVTITGGALSLYWKGGASGTWDKETTTNWSADAAATVADKTFYDLDTVIFDTADAEVYVSGAVVPGAIAVNENTTLTGTDYSVASGGNVEIASDKTLMLDGTGTLFVASATNLSGAGTVSLGENAVLSLTEKLTSQADLGSKVSGTGTIAVIGGIENGQGVVLGDDFAGTLYVKKDAQDSRLLLSDSSFGNVAAKILVADGADLVFNDVGTEISNAITLEGDARIIVNSEKSGTLSGNISATGMLEKNGAGTLTLSGANIIGTLQVYSGTVNISGAGTTKITGNISVSNGSTITQSAGTVSAVRLVLNDSKDGAGSFYELSGGVFNISGDGKQTASRESTDNAILIGHWPNGTSKLTVSGGVLNATSGITTVSWDSAGTLEISGGEANLYGITLNLDSWYRNAAKVALSSGRLNLGVGGLVSGNAANKTVALSGGTLGALDDWDSSAAMTIAGNVTIDTTKMTASETGTATSMGTGATITLGGKITQAADATLTVSGAGMLKITGTDTFGGNISVSGGTLVIGGTTTFSGNVDVASGVLDLSGADVTLANAITNSATVKVSSDSVFVLSDSLKNGDTYTLISNNERGVVDGWDAITLSNFRYADGKYFSKRSTFNVSTNGALTITGGALSLYWKGGASGTWDTETTTNWSANAAATVADDKFYDLDTVIFDTANAEVSVSGTVVPAAITVNENTTLTGTDYAVTPSGNVEIASDKTLTFGGTGTLPIASAANLSGAGTVCLESDARLLLTEKLTAQVDLGTKVSGTGTIAVIGGTGNGQGVVLGNDFTGTLYVKKDAQDSRLLLSDSSFGNAAKILVADGAQLVFNDVGTVISNAITFEGNSGIHVNKEKSGTLRGNISAAGTFVKYGGGTLTLSGNCDIGTLRVAQGTLRVTEGCVLAAGVLTFVREYAHEDASLIVAEDGVLTGKVSYMDTETSLILEGTGAKSTVELSGSKSISGNLTIGNATVTASEQKDIFNYSVSQSQTITLNQGGTLDLGESLQSFSEKVLIKLNGGTITGAGDADGAMDFYTTGNISVMSDSEISATIRVRYTVSRETGDVTFAVADGATLTLSGRINKNQSDESNTTRKIIKSGAGTMKLTADNSYFAAGFVVSGGTLVADHANALGSGTTQVKSGELSLSAETLGGMAAKVEVGGSEKAEYGKNETASGVLRGGFLRVTSDSAAEETDVSSQIFNSGKCRFTSNGGLILSGGTFGINEDSASAAVFATTDGAKLHLRNGANINGSVFVARGTELIVGETSTTHASSGTVPPASAGTFATGVSSSIAGDFTLDGKLTIFVSDDSLIAGTPLLGIGGSVVLDTDSGAPAEIYLDLSDTSVSLDSVAVTILGGTFSGDASALSSLLTVTDSTGETWLVTGDSGHLMLYTAVMEYNNPPKGLREFYAAVKDSDLGIFIGKNTERLVALSPVSFGALIEMQSGFASLENDLLRERLEQRRYDRAISGGTNVKFTPFVNVFGSERESDGDGTDSANYDMTHTGVFGGFDAAVSSNTILGVSAGFDLAKARLHDGAGKHEGDGFRLGVYGMSQFENTYFGYGLSVGGMSFDTKRNTGYNNESVTGETDGNDVNASFLFGAEWKFGNGVDIAPFVGFDIGYARTKSFSEKDGNATALDVEKTERWSVRGKIGAALNWRATESLRFGLEASFAHEFLDTEADIDATFASGSAAGTKFTSTAYLMDENTIQIGPRVDFRIDETWSLSAAYTFETDLADTTTHSANVGLRARF